MTDEELAAINERWKWILHDLLPDANQAKVDVRALYDEVKRLQEREERLLDFVGWVAQEIPDYHTSVEQHEKAIHLVDQLIDSE